MMRCAGSAGPLWVSAVASALVSAVAAQASGWDDGQVNTTMCTWTQLRATAVRDALYMDGGTLLWMPGMSDGSYGGVTTDINPPGIVYTLNFSVPFRTSDNITALMGNLSKVGANSASNNIAPNYVDGAMLANDAEWFLYGGLLRQTNAYTPPDSDEVLAYQAAQYGVDKPAFRPGFLQDKLPTNLTRYLAYGGAANAPSENKAWYFSGMHAPGWGPIYEVGANASLTAINVSNTLVTLDMATQQSETWTNTTLPPTVAGRANPELVWVPVGEQGVLVALGGVVYPEFVTAVRKSQNEAASKQTSPGFMTTVDVYDVKSATWYQQATDGDAPGQLTRGCAVVATAADASSFNIYWYGGYDGLDVVNGFSDAVYVLSLPSFSWIKLSNGTSAHARAGHKCVKPYPDQMLVVGGTTASSGIATACLGGGLVQLFNLSSAEWMTSYDPRVWSNYSVPSAVTRVIGGSGSGGATATKPAVSGGWNATALASVFATSYPTSQIKTFYPYPVASSTNATHPDLPATSTPSSGGGSHTPKFLAPLLGVVCGLIFVTLVIMAFILYRRRGFICGGRHIGGSRRLSGAAGPGGSGGGGGAGGGAGATSDASTYDTRRNFISSWLRAMPSVKQASTLSSPSSSPASFAGSTQNRNASANANAHDAPVSASPPDMAEASATRAPSAYFSGRLRRPPAEVADTSIAEMMADTALPAELPGTAVASPAHRHFGVGSLRWRSGSAATDSELDGGGAGLVHPSSAELDSTTSNNSGAAAGRSQTTAGTTPSPPSAASMPRPDSPPLGTAAVGGVYPKPVAPAPAPQKQKQKQHTSGVSDLSETERAHLRQGSEGGESVASSTAVSAMAVSPTSPALPATSTLAATAAAAVRPQPIPEADVDAEQRAEKEPLQKGRLHTAAATTATAATGSPARPSVFRESESDLSG